jgi:hypothetical protein
MFRVHEAASMSFWGDQIKEDETGGAHSLKKCIQNVSQKIRREKPLGDLGTV